MDQFWSWLMHANAKRVFIGAMVAFLGVSGWWIWREFNPSLPPLDTPPKSRTEIPYDTLALLSYLDEQLADGQTAVPGNPFLSSDAPWIWTARPNVASARAATNAYAIINVIPPAIGRPRFVVPPKPVRATAPPPKVTNPVATVRPPKTGPKRPGPKSIAVTYKGMFIRPDGTKMILIEDADSERPSYYPVGQSLFGNTVTEASTREVKIRRADGRQQIVPIREETSIRDHRP